jgi:hypothetical protein
VIFKTYLLNSASIITLPFISLLFDVAINIEVLQRGNFVAISHIFSVLPCHRNYIGRFMQYGVYDHLVACSM